MPRLLFSRIRFIAIVVPVPPVTETPIALPAIRLPAAGIDRLPMLVLAVVPPTRMPAIVLGRLIAPLASRPMMLPSIEVLLPPTS